MRVTPISGALVGVCSRGVTTTGALTWEQRCWMAVLHAGPRSLLGGLSAAELRGLTGWHRETNELAVMLDTYRPLHATADARSVEDPDYHASFE